MAGRKQYIDNKDRWFDGWLVAKSPALKELCEHTASILIAYEKRAGLRKSDRKKTLPDHLRRIEGVVCNLAFSVIKQGGNGKIVTPLHKGNGRTNRYDNKLFDGEGLPPILALFNAMRLLTVSKGAWKGSATTMQPTPGFEEEVRSRDITRQDFGRDPHQELIVLTRTTKGGKQDDDDTDTDNGMEGLLEATARGGLLNYRDTERTHSLRAQMMRLGDHLANADIRYVGSDTNIDVDDRLLRRHFSLPLKSKTPTFDLGGRLFCRGLSYIPKTERQHLRIDGERVMLADYSAMFPHLCYGLSGVTPPSEDLYALPGFEANDRAGIKMAFNALLFGAGRKPGARWPDEVRGKLPNGVGVKTLREAILKKHPMLMKAGRWETQNSNYLGYHLMFLESEIMVAVLEELMALATTAIGLHDGLLVPASKAGITKQIMEAKAIEIGRVAIPVVVKDVKQDT